MAINNNIQDWKKEFNEIFLNSPKEDESLSLPLSLITDQKKYEQHNIRSKEITNRTYEETQKGIELILAIFEADKKIKATAFFYDIIEKQLIIKNALESILKLLKQNANPNYFVINAYCNNTILENLNILDSINKKNLKEKNNKYYINSEQDCEFINKNKYNLNNTFYLAGFTPLMLATLLESLPIVNLLLEYNANVNELNRYWLTALVYATNYGANEIAKLLLNHGAISSNDIFCKKEDLPFPKNKIINDNFKKEFRNILDLACEYCSLEVVKLIVEKNKFFNQDDILGNSVFFSINILDNIKYSPDAFLKKRCDELKLIISYLFDKIKNPVYQYCKFNFKYSNKNYKNLLEYFKDVNSDLYLSILADFHNTIGINEFFSQKDIFDLERVIIDKAESLFPLTYSGSTNYLTKKEQHLDYQNNLELMLNTNSSARSHFLSYAFSKQSENELNMLVHSFFNKIDFKLCTFFEEREEVNELITFYENLPYKELVENFPSCSKNILLIIMEYIYQMNYTHYLPCLSIIKKQVTKMHSDHLYKYQQIKYKLDKIDEFINFFYKWFTFSIDETSHQIEQLNKYKPLTFQAQLHQINEELSEFQMDLKQNDKHLSKIKL